MPGKPPRPPPHPVRQRTDQRIGPRQAAYCSDVYRRADVPRHARSCGACRSVRTTGWSAPDATGRPLQEVLRIIDADSREPFRDPLAIAMRRGAIVGLADSCLLIRRDGRESAVEDTAALVHDGPSQRRVATAVHWRSCSWT
jgi:hypothetical protein